MPTALTKPRTLWILFWLLLAESMCFAAIMAIWDFAIIDEMSDPEKIRLHIAEMTLTQRHVHAWTTATLDVVYPLTYGPLLAGLALRRFPALFAVPAIAVIPTDLVEGVVQVLVLTGNDSLLWLKAYVTPLKLILFFAAIAIAVCALVIGVRRWRQERG